MKNGLKKTTDEKVKTAAEIIEDVRITMLTTFADGKPSSRPLYVQEIDFEGSLWIFTSKNAPFMEEIRKKSLVGLTFESATKNKYLSATAVGFEVDNRAKMEELWTPFLKAWFKQGLDTPDIVLLRLDLQDVEFWDAPNSPVVKVVGLMKALLSDETYQPGRHESLDLRH